MSRSKIVCFKTNVLDMQTASIVSTIRIILNGASVNSE